MATQAREQLDGSAVRVAGQIVAIAPEILAQRQQQPEVPTMPLLRERLPQVVALLADFTKADRLVVGYESLQVLVEHLGKLLSELEKIRASGPHLPDNEAVRQAAGTATHLADKICGVALPIVAYLVAKDRGLVATHEAELSDKQKAAAQSLKSIKDELTSIAELRRLAEENLEAIQKSAGEAGVSTHATEFKVLAEGHAKAAVRWLVATVAAALFTVAVVLWLVKSYPLDADAKPGVIAQYVLTRAVLFATISFISVWASKNHRAHRHLAVLNQHRNKALLTFQTFVGAAKDEATKSAVLLEATRCIFSAGATGYSGDDGSASPAQFIEIVKTFVDKK